MDLFTRVIVSWSVDDNMQESLVREPLEKALLKRVSAYFWTKTERPSHGMSRADDPYDNAFAESLWSRLKTELEMPNGGYENLEVLRSILFEFIEEYRAAYRYNRQRLHSSLKYEFPLDFETQWFEKNGEKV